MGLVTTEHCADGVEAWENEGGALPGRAAADGSPAQAIAIDSARR